MNLSTWATGCPLCRQRIVWALSDRGNLFPVDLAPCPSGNFVLALPEHAHERPVASIASSDERRDGKAHRSHYGTCAKPEAWRPAPPASTRGTPERLP